MMITGRLNLKTDVGGPVSIIRCPVRQLKMEFGI